MPLLMLARSLGAYIVATPPTMITTSNSPNVSPSSWMGCVEVVVNVSVAGFGVSVDTLVVVLVA